MNKKSLISRRNYLFAMALALISVIAWCDSQINSSSLADPATPEPAFDKIAARPSAPFDGDGWKSLYDGKTLGDWKCTDFIGHGGVSIKSGLIVLETGNDLTGVNWTKTNDLPTVNYEVALDAMKLDGSDFFCGLTFPVRKSYCTLILGGWGGTMVGLSSLDGEDASENITSTNIDFDMNRWYRVRVRVTDKKIQAWLDENKIIDVITTNRNVSLRIGEIEDSMPLGVASYETRSALRQIKIRTLPSQ